MHGVCRLGTVAGLSGKCQGPLEQQQLGCHRRYLAALRLLRWFGLALGQLPQPAAQGLLLMAAPEFARPDPQPQLESVAGSSAVVASDRVAASPVAGSAALVESDPCAPQPSVAETSCEGGRPEPSLADPSSDAVGRPESGVGEPVAEPAVAEPYVVVALEAAACAVQEQRQFVARAGRQGIATAALGLLVQLAASLVLVQFVESAMACHPFVVALLVLPELPPQNLLRLVPMLPRRAAAAARATTWQVREG